MATMVLIPILWWWLGVQGICYAMGGVAGIGVYGVAVGVRRYADIEWSMIVVIPIIAMVVGGLSSIIYSVLELDFSSTIGNLAVRAFCVGGVYCSVIWALDRKRLMLYFSQLRDAVSLV